MERTEQIKTVGSWIKDLAQALGAELSLDQDGSCIFQVGENTVIGIEVSFDLPLVHLYSPLLQLPQEPKEASHLMLIRALELNAFQTLTRGGAIGIAPGGGPLIFCYTLPIEGTNSETFNKILGSFYETIPEIKRLVAEAPTSDILEERQLKPHHPKSHHPRSHHLMEHGHHIMKHGFIKI